MSDDRVLDKIYDPRAVEPRVYGMWEQAGAFRSHPADPPTPHEKTFTIVIPPPNVTGALHLGHALNNTLQDILIRYHRMRGFNTLWQSGTDHAGIATQAVVERRIREQEGKTRNELGREELVRRIWEWKDEYEARIIGQLKLMGCSCDWGRNRFTLDEGMSRAVRHMFFKLFKDGLIFRGKRLVNWDTQLQTAVSDDEVYYETVKGHFYHFRYPFDFFGSPREADEPEYVVIATTRPETMLGDTAVAVHPDPAGELDRRERELCQEQDRASAKDKVDIEKKLQAITERRETHLPLLVTLSRMAKEGRKIRLPLVDRVIPLIVDEWADPMLGSGCVKITPAHDPNDYQVGVRRNLPMINVLTADGKIARFVEENGYVTKSSENYAGLDFSTAGRAKVVADIESAGLLEKIEDREIEIGHSDRSKTPIEPYLSDQWFVKTDDPEPRASARAMIPGSVSTVESATIRPTPDLSQGATFLTWTAYGTWLPGEARGSVSRAPRASGRQELRNLPGEPYDTDDQARFSNAAERMEGDPVSLAAGQAEVILRTIADTAERHAIELLAIAIMSNYVHVLCQAGQHGQELLQLFKGNCSRRLSQQFKLEGSPRWWTKSGSRRRIKAGADLTAAIDYVKDQENPFFVWSFDVDKGKAADLVKTAWTAASQALRGDSSASGDIARAEARGSGLASAAMQVVEDGQIQVFPSRYAKSYLDWLGEKRDWCISRQLWWGHRIPVWKGPSTLWSEDDVSRYQLFKRFPNTDSFPEWRTDGIAGQAVFDKGSGAAVPYSCVDDKREELERMLERRDYERDADVLDTWFSSALWPFSTLGWPEETSHLKQYYPGSVLCTSRDIITNWVARMVMFGLYAMGKVPFDHVYIHPKILDGRGETMSKSKGNGVDPVDIIHTHGADALRYTMADMTTETQDIRMPVEYVCPHCGKLVDQQAALKAEEQHRKSRGQKLERKLQPSDCLRVRCTNGECKKEFATQWADVATKKEIGLARESSDKFDIGRNFCNKLWNAARFAFMNLEGTRCEKINLAKLPPEDRWILARLSQTVRRYHECIQAYQFSASVKELRDFFWDSLCDWYIELTKPRLMSAVPPSDPDDVQDMMLDSATGSGNLREKEARQVLAFCLDQVLRLWHPTIPFITEHLWQQLNRIVPKRGLPGVEGVGAIQTDRPLILAEFPPVGGYPALEDEGILATFSELQAATRGVRDLRGQSGVSPKDKVDVTVVVSPGHRDAFAAHSHIVRHMAGIRELDVVGEGKRPANAASMSIRGLRIFVHDVSDDEAERVRAAKALEAVEKQIAGKEAKLGNAQFVDHAPRDVVDAERARLSELQAQFTALKDHLRELSEMG